uniref:glutamate-cysteine ligase family protein n=1 Tax=Nocardioides sp. TaxID=35761 RepID=UPI00356A8282
MTAKTMVDTPPEGALLDAADPRGHAHAHVAAQALRSGSERRVGLELEFHLIDLVTPLRRPTWAAIRSLVDRLPPMPSGSSVTLEPGGQIELSTPVSPDVSSAVAALREDRSALRAELAERRYGAVPL